VAKPAPEAFVLFTGDHHVGSTAGLAPKAECRNSDQEWLLVCWQDIVKRAKAAASKKSFVLCLGGDHQDGARQHGTWETWGSAKDQRDAAVDLLRPLANMADDIRAVLGTEVHAGPKGDDDRTVAEEIGAKRARYVWKFAVGGRRVFWSHHGVSVARDPWNDSNGMYAMAKRLYYGALRRGQAPPDLAIVHHAHFSPEPVTAYNLTVAVCPCLKLSDGHGFKIGPEKTPAIGALAWWPAEKRLERWLYTQPEDYEEIKFKAR
jgi:hypothetical protein